EKAAALRDQEKQTKEKLDGILASWREEREEKEVLVTADDMMHIISKVTGVPLQRMEQKETAKLLAMEAELRQRVIGQEEAVTAISKALRRSRADLIRRQTTMGFGAPKDSQDYDSMREKILEETKRAFKPEFLNRLDEIIVFRTLSKPDLLQIVDLEVDKVKRRLKLKEIEIVLDEPAHEFVINKGYDPTYGARPMRRAVERYLEDPLAEELLKGTVKAGDIVEVKVASEDKLGFQVAEPHGSPAASAS